MLLAYEDLAAAFGKENVVQADPAVVEGIELTPEGKRALVEIGLPRYFGDGAFEAVTPEVVDAPTLNTRLCRLGRTIGRDYVVDLATGEAWSVSTHDPAINPSFLNSDLPAFVQCVAHYGMVMTELPDQRSDDVSALWSERLRERLEAVDPRCLTHENAYYASVVFEIKIGML